ncbi:MAG: hypothetical protein V1656_00135 [Candidatus Jorgensenbacteria bacterium]
MPHKFLHWAPRILSLLFVGFISLFALDTFDTYSGWAAVLPFLMHLIPSFVLLAVIIVAWKYDLVGAVLFLVSAALYVGVAGLYRPRSWYLLISGPAALVGILFLLNWFGKRKSQPLRP